MAVGLSKYRSGPKVNVITEGKAKVNLPITEYCESPKAAASESFRIIEPNRIFISAQPRPGLFFRTVEEMLSV